MATARTAHPPSSIPCQSYTSQALIYHGHGQTGGHACPVCTETTNITQSPQASCDSTQAPSTLWGGVWKGGACTQAGCLACKQYLTQHILHSYSCSCSFHLHTSPPARLAVTLPLQLPPHPLRPCLCPPPPTTQPQCLQHLPLQVLPRLPMWSSKEASVPGGVCRCQLLPGMLPPILACAWRDSRVSRMHVIFLLRPSLVRARSGRCLHGVGCGAAQSNHGHCSVHLVTSPVLFCVLHTVCILTYGCETNWR